ncbi:MAG: hypothetical protein QM756_37215 [Polyangiaceae bacterium]
MDYEKSPLYRPPVRTLLTFEQVAEAIPIAFQSAEGTAPTLKTVAKLIAQSSLETGHYQHMWNYNFGNVKKRWQPDDGLLFTMFRCNEIIGGKVQWFDPPHPQTHFRAFESAAAGVIDWQRLILKVQRYAPAKALLVDDKVSGHDFAFKLGECGYYTADKDTYSNAVDRLTETSFAKLQALANKPAPAPNLPAAPLTDAERERIQGLIGVTAMESIYDYFRGSPRDDANS